MGGCRAAGFVGAGRGAGGVDDIWTDELHKIPLSVRRQIVTASLMVTGALKNDYHM